MHHITAMDPPEPETCSKPRQRGMIVRACMFWGGLLLVVISPLVGAIPGPGGIFVFAAGFGLMLRGSKWVKKMYARFKKRHPKKGDWADFGLRRASYRRRMARAKAQDAEEGIPLGAELAPPPDLRKSGDRPGH